VRRTAAAACAALPLCVALGGDGGRRLALHPYGISVFVPTSWHVSRERVNAVVDPVTLFTASTFPLEVRRTDRAGRWGVCSRPIQRAWRKDGAYVQVVEERDGASRRRMLRRVPHRPRHFQLDARGGGGLCTPPNSGEIVFQQGGRAFYVFYGIGPEASRTVRAQARLVLNSLRITPRG
jgi:hypothetical protein